MKSILLPILGVIAFIIFVGVLTQKTQTIQTPQPKQVKVGTATVAVEIADTESLRRKGLSGRTTLGQNSGMLFVFDQKKVFPSFWMKDMLFPLDLIWITDGQIAKIDKNLPIPTPEQNSLSTVPLYTPDKPIDYALEVNAGFADKHNLKVGDNVDLSGAP